MFCVGGEGNCEVGKEDEIIIIVVDFVGVFGFVMRCVFLIFIYF